MGIGTSLLLIAVGAILRFAVTATTSAVNLHTVGLILMIVGAVGLLISLIDTGRAVTTPRTRRGRYQPPRQSRFAARRLSAASLACLRLSRRH